MGKHPGYVIQQKWDIDKRKYKKNVWEIRKLNKKNTKVHTSRSYTNAVKWIRKHGKKH